MHGWTYSLETGKATTGSGMVKSYRVIVEDDTVYCEKPADR
jgi:nitrite reductase/ring-hydroxylating ferredoxin subunit